MKVTKEVAFEDAIAQSLDTSGYTRGLPTNYVPAVSFDTAELFTFIGATQADEWEDLVQRNGAIPMSHSDGSSSGSRSRSTSAARSTCSVTASRTWASTSGWPTSARPRG